MAVLVATLALCAAQGGIDKLLPPLVWTALPGSAAWSSSPPAEARHHWVLAFAGMTMGMLADGPAITALVWLGAVSYCLYLVNEPVQKLLGVTLASLVRGDAALFTAVWIPGAVVLPDPRGVVAARMDRGAGTAVGS